MDGYDASIQAVVQWTEMPAQAFGVKKKKKKQISEWW